MRQGKIEAAKRLIKSLETDFDIDLFLLDHPNTTKAEVRMYEELYMEAYQNGYFNGHAIENPYSKDSEDYIQFEQGKNQAEQDLVNYITEKSFSRYETSKGLK